MKYIYSIETTFQGVYVVYGIIGTRQYMGYTKAEARKMYNEACREVLKK